jgi:hypothetical protein
MSATLFQFHTDTKFQDFYCVLLSAKTLNSDCHELSEKVYDFWYQNWATTFSEIGHKFSATSEEFCRHDEVVALIHKNHVVACVLLDKFDLSSQVHLKHKYFLNYPETVLRQLRFLSAGAPVLTVGYLTIHAEYRGTLGVSDLVLGLAVKRFFESRCKIMISYTRNSRKTNQLTSRLGARTIEKNLTVNGEPSDFVFFDQSAYEILCTSPHSILIDLIWKDRLFNLTNSAGAEEKGNQYDRNEFEIRV